MPKERTTLTDQVRALFKGVLDPIAAYLNRLGIPPNTITLVGLVGHIIAAFFVSQGRMTTGALFIILLGPVDALDGTMARLRGEPTRWGGFVDSVVDRYSELFVFGGLLYYFLTQENWLGAMLAYLAASGSILVSYVRARAQAVGYDIKTGWFSRLERYLVLVPALVLNFPLYGAALIALGSHITSLQRILAMRSRAHHEQGPR